MHRIPLEGYQGMRGHGKKGDFFTVMSSVFLEDQAEEAGRGRENIIDMEFHEKRQFQENKESNEKRFLKSLGGLSIYSEGFGGKE